MRFILEIADTGVDFLCLDLPDIDPTTSAGRMLLIGLANFAEFESRRIGERIRAAMAAWRARMVAAGRGDEYRALQRAKADRGRAAFVAAARARRERVYPVAAALRALPMTYEAVATRMNARRIPTPRGKRWTAGLVHHLLTKHQGA